LVREKEDVKGAALTGELLENMVYTIVEDV